MRHTTLARGSDRELIHLRWIFDHIIGRCTNPRNNAFAYYGGRGISICDEWRNSFAQFVSDMGPRPFGATLDRIDNSGNYEPRNCRWATRSEQSRNRRNCIYVDHDGERMTLKELCERRGLRYQSIQQRITARGWNVEQAINTPLHRPKGQHYVRNSRSTAK